MADGTADAVFAAFFRALKPGGMLGLEEHRGRTDEPQDPKAKSGYVRQDYVIALAEKAGFKLAGTSEANANSKDTKDYPDGVWTLPPSYRLKDKDHDQVCGHRRERPHAAEVHKALGRRALRSGSAARDACGSGRPNRPAPASRPARRR